MTLRPLIAFWHHRWLFRTLLERELRNRYVGSTGGALWALANPLLQLAIYAFVFRAVFRVDFPALGQNSFVAFVAVALWPWMAFQEGIQRGAQAIQANASLVRKVAFPQELLVISAVTASFVVHLGGFVLVLAVIGVFGSGIALVALPMVLAVIVVLFILSLALAMVLAALQVFLRDVDHILGPAMMVLFYVTPILYPLSLVPAWMADVMTINPLVHLIEPIRDALLYGKYTFGGPELLVWGASFALLLLAHRAFDRLSPHFEDFV